MGARTNISLIGMPGAGKSTVGVLLAKETGRNFLDTDVLIQARQGRTLQTIIDADGLQKFLLLEEEAILSIGPAELVVATGGSVVYSADSMRRLKQCGPVVYLRLPLELLLRRLTNMATRGVVMAAGDSLADLYGYRCPLYERWADVVVDCEGMTQDQLAVEIAARIGK